MSVLHGLSYSEWTERSTEENIYLCWKLQGLNWTHNLLTLLLSTLFVTMVSWKLPRETQDHLFWRVHPSAPVTPSSYVCYPHVHWNIRIYWYILDLTFHISFDKTSSRIQSSTASRIGDEWSFHVNLYLTLTWWS